MATQSNTIPAARAATAIQHLYPRFMAIRAALDALEPIMSEICDRPSPTYNALQTIFDNLLAELDAVGIVLCGLDPADLPDLALQAEVIRYRYSEGPDMDAVPGPLGQLLDHIVEMAA